MGKRVVAVVLALSAAGMLSACGSGPKHTIVYDVLEAQLTASQTELPVDKIEYDYSTGGSGGPTSGDTLGSGTPLPWHKSVTVHGDLFRVIVHVELDTPGTADISTLPVVQCQVTVDGKLLMTKSGPGSVACEVDQAAFAG